MCGGSGGDGGYQERQDKMKADQDAAIQKINTAFGKGLGTPLYATSANPASNAGGDTYGSVVQPSTTTALTGYDTSGRDANAAGLEKLYGSISTDANARLTDNLNQDRTKAERQVRFQLARQGLAGGSADIDQGADILKQYQKGSLEASTAATAAGNTARSGDEKTRISIINNVRNGMSEADAISAASAGMQNNANEARDAAMQTDIGSFFGDLAVLNSQARYQQGMAAGKANGAGIVYGTGSSGGNNGSIFGGGR